MQLPSLCSLLNSVMQEPEFVLPQPRHAPRHRRNMVPPNFTPRKSSRIAKADCSLDSEMKAKKVLLRRLGLLEEEGQVDDSILAKYAQLFARPLAEDVVQAFGDYYGWQIPRGVTQLLDHAPVSPVLISS